MYVNLKQDDKRPYQGSTEFELLKPLFESSQCYYRVNILEYQKIK